MSNEAKIAALIKQTAEQQDKWPARDITPLASKKALELSDWVEITGISGDEIDGHHGLYKITPEAVSFVGIPLERLRSQPIWEQPELLRQNNHRLIFPCTSRELVAFVDADTEDFCGSLFGVISEEFRKAVEESPIDPTPAETKADLVDSIVEAVNGAFREVVKEIPIDPHLRSDAALGATFRQKLVAFSERSHEIRDAREEEWERWNVAAKQIALTWTRRPSLRQLAALVKVKLDPNDSEETIRKRLKPIDELWAKPATSLS